MPPRKSDAASRKSDAAAAAVATDNSQDVTSSADKAGAEQTADGDARPTSSGNAGAEKEKEKEPPKPRNNDAVTIEDLNMPRSIITRLAKGVLPPNTQVQGSAITGMSKSATVFISHLANAANNLTTNAGKKTIMPADVFAALDDIEFGFMREQLEAEFAKFTHIQTSKRSDYRKRVAAAKKGADGDKQGDDEGDDADISAMGAEGDVSLAGASAAGDGKALAKSRDAPPQAKKAKRTHDKGGKANGNGTADDETEVDEEDVEMGDGEEVEEEEEDDDDGEEEEDDEEEEEEEDEDEGDGDEDVDREDAPDEDEALDSDGSE